VPCSGVLRSGTPWTFGSTSCRPDSTRIRPDQHSRRKTLERFSTIFGGLVVRLESAYLWRIYEVTTGGPGPSGTEMTCADTSAERKLDMNDDRGAARPNLLLAAATLVGGGVVASGGPSDCPGPRPSGERSGSSPA
jgi:hypothetical protein